MSCNERLEHQHSNITSTYMHNTSKQVTTQFGTSNVPQRGDHCWPGIQTGLDCRLQIATQVKQVIPLPAHAINHNAFVLQPTKANLQQHTLQWLPACSPHR